MHFVAMSYFRKALDAWLPADAARPWKRRVRTASYGDAPAVTTPLQTKRNAFLASTSPGGVPPTVLAFPARSLGVFASTKPTSCTIDAAVLADVVADATRRSRDVYYGRDERRADALDEDHADDDEVEALADALSGLSGVSLESEDADPPCEIHVTPATPPFRFVGDGAPDVPLNVEPWICFTPRDDFKAEPDIDAQWPFSAAVNAWRPTRKDRKMAANRVDPKWRDASFAFLQRPWTPSSRARRCRR